MNYVLDEQEYKEYQDLKNKLATTIKGDFILVNDLASHNLMRYMGGLNYPSSGSVLYTKDNLLKELNAKIDDLQKQLDWYLCSFKTSQDIISKTPREFRKWYKLKGKK